MALNVDSQTQGKAFLFLIKTNSAKLLPGEMLTGFLETAGEPTPGFIIPSSAVVRADGKAWIYIFKDEDHFFKREITTEAPVEGGWFVKDMVKTGEKMISTGAQSTYSEEVKGSLGSAD